MSQILLRSNPCRSKRFKDFFFSQRFLISCAPLFCIHTDLPFITEEFKATKLNTLAFLFNNNERMFTKYRTPQHVVIFEYFSTTNIDI